MPETDKKAQEQKLASVDQSINAVEAAVADYHRQQTIKKRRRGINERNYAMNEVQEAHMAYQQGRIRSKSHQDAILRMGINIITGAFLVLTLLAVGLGIQLVRVSSHIAERPIYERDPEGFTTRLLLDKNARGEGFIRDQLEEYTGNVLTCLYTYNPEGQPRIDLLTNLVAPEIINAEREYYQKRLQKIVSSREIRTVAVNYVEPQNYNRERGFAIVDATGTLIYNNNRESIGVPIKWKLLIELKPEIQSGPNVYGMILTRLEEVAEKPE
jgi:hypothetical protein